MKQKLNCILLIDNDKATNFMNQLVIDEVDCTESIIALKSGHEALDFLKSIENEEHRQPQLIFIDINMPAMNGWEFLEEYEKLCKEQVIILLTTSINPEDKKKAKTYKQLNDFKTKPLTEEILQEIFEEHFPDHL